MTKKRKTVLLTVLAGLVIPIVELFVIPGLTCWLVLNTPDAGAMDRVTQFFLCGTGGAFAYSLGIYAMVQADALSRRKNGG